MPRLAKGERRLGVLRDRYERRMQLELVVAEGDFVYLRIWVGREFVLAMDIDEMGLLTLMQASEKALVDVLHINQTVELP